MRLSPPTPKGFNDRPATNQAICLSNKVVKSLTLLNAICDTADHTSAPSQQRDTCMSPSFKLDLISKV
jgi:hypothetical protein